VERRELLWPGWSCVWGSPSAPQRRKARVPALGSSALGRWAAGGDGASGGLASWNWRWSGLLELARASWHRCEVIAGGNCVLERVCSALRRTDCSVEKWMFKILILFFVWFVARKLSLLVCLPVTSGKVKQPSNFNCLYYLNCLPLHNLSKLTLNFRRKRL